MERTFAIVEREMRRFRRSPMLIVMSLIMPIVQLVVLGYAFGGQVKNLKLGVVDQDRGMPAVRMRELAGAVAANAKTFVPVPYPDLGQAVTALRNGELNGVLAIPPDFSRRVLAKERSARCDHRGQHGRFRRGLDGRDRGQHGGRVRPARNEHAACLAVDDARCRRGVSVRAVHPVPALRAPS